MSCVVQEPSVTHGLNVGTNAFVQGASSRANVTLGLIGPGRVGGALIGQLRRACADPHRRPPVGLFGIASRNVMRLADQDILVGECVETSPSDLDAFVAHLRKVATGPIVIADCTASDEIAGRYADWLSGGIHVVTPNKFAGSGPLDRWSAIQRAREAGGHHRYEATVGAGLPVINTLRDLLDTGDELIAIEGMLSGTIAWLLNRYDGTTPFSKLVKEAYYKGLTEPNPADDLSGMDVARKLVILAREAGIGISLDDVCVTPVVPMPTTNLNPKAYFAYMSNYDSEMQSRLQRARLSGRTLRYVASLSANGSASVRLEEMGADHPFSRTGLTDNVARFCTSRYDSNPLHVQGPGAGAEVTAAAVFADVLRVMRELSS
jgi:homoserine dehydrogenase